MAGNHFSTIADRRRSAPVDALLTLRDYSAAAINATASAAAIEFDSRKVDMFKVVLNHAAIASVAAGTAEWTIAIQVSATQGGTYTTIASRVLGAAAGEFEFSFSGTEVAQLLATARWMRVTATKAGSVGDLTYGVQIYPGC